MKIPTTSIKHLAALTVVALAILLAFFYGEALGSHRPPPPPLKHGVAFHLYQHREMH